jgi:spoIIIJ-associated protein
LPPQEPKPAEAAEAPQKLRMPVMPEMTAVEATTAAAHKARELLSGILSKMTFECQVKAMETEDTIILSISGDESGLLIGRRGQNLDAIQYVLNKAINKIDTDRKMIVVDSEDYRKRRQESLLIMAERIRDKVKKTQKPLSLAHMNAHDRRIIHLALQEDETLVTKSRGEGEFRKVIVLPAKSRTSGGNSRARNRQ